MSKRVLFTTTNLHLPSGGSEALWSKVACHIAAKREHSVAALVNHWNPTPSHIAAITRSGGTVLNFQISHPVPPTKAKILANRLLPSRYQFQPIYPKPRLHELKAFDPHLVVVSFGDLFQPSEVLDYLGKTETPYVTIVQLVGEFSIKNDEYIANTAGYFRNARLNCFLSRKNIALAEQLLGQRINNAVLVKNPCSQILGSLDYPSTKNGYRLAFPARFHTLHKGLDILLNVMRQENWKQRDIVVNCFGDGPNKKQLERLKEMWEVDNVNFLPFVNDISQIWKDHHALVMSSRMEGFPLVAIEAMASGRMVITTNVGAGDELVTHSKDGFVANTATAEGLDAALEEAWQRRDRWAEMGESALMVAKKYLATDPVVEMAGLIESVI